MGDLAFDKESFWTRLKVLYDTWKSENAEAWKNLDSIVILNGKPNEDVLYMKTWALQLWLCGYELFDTLIAFTQDAVYICASAKKLSLFQNTGDKNDGISLHLLAKAKDDSGPEFFAKVIDVLKKSGNGKNIGMLLKDKQSGPFADEFTTELKKSEEEGLKVVDATPAISEILAIKDSKEQNKTKLAAEISAAVLNQVTIAEIETIIEEEKKVTHQEIADKTEQVLTTPDKLRKIIPANVKIVLEDVESCYTPIIMSGGKFDLKPSAQSDDQPLHYQGAVIVALGARYEAYCSNIARTLLIDSSPDQEKAYKALVRVHQACVQALKVGAKISDVYRTAIKLLRSKYPDLEGNFVKNCGFGTGIDFRDVNYLLNASNQRKITSGMIFNLAVGFEKLERKGTIKDEKNRSYALFIADTVLVTTKESVVLTGKSPIEFSEISYQMEGGDDDEVDLDTAVEIAKRQYADDFGPRTRGSRKTKQDDAEASAAAEKRREEQKALAKKKREEALKQFTANQMNTHFDTKKERGGVINSYADAGRFPDDSSPSQLYVDVPSESILVPINGQLVPFHVDFIKNVSKSEQADFTILRINFITPDIQSNTLKVPPYADRNGIFIRELSYKSKNPQNLNKVHRLIKELQKRIKQRETEIAEESSMVAQPDLIPHRDKKMVPRLRDLQIRPKLPGKKKNTGTLEAHTNGFRFLANNGVKIDILYSNIKHAFFQPCEGTVSVILHFELKHAIKIEKKRTNYVQVFVDVIEVSQDLGQRQRIGDRDGLQEEQEERLRKKRYNAAFKTFVREVEENMQKFDGNHAFEFDIPWKDLMFQGVPNKSSVQILPTVNCLIALEDNPPWILSFDEIEVAYFERVQLSLKHFDLVFVYKDFDRPVEKIRSIASQSLDTIQQYLNEIEILYFVGPMNLQWPRILKEIQKNPKEFYEMGGWEEVLGEQEGEDDEEEAESEFEPEESDAGSDDSDEYESDDGDEGADEDEEDFEDESEDEDAPSWEELENQARVADKKRQALEEEQMGRDRERERKKAKTGHSSSSKGSVPKRR